MCAGNDALLRVGPFIIARRYKYRQHQPAMRRCGVRPCVMQGAETRLFLGDVTQGIEQVAALT
jgi:hypothetical protein